ncbi:tetratricopeptide repeat protein, partial [Fusobacterium sp.]|uniref:tetratricopeptide repeat protein n=1 Tax=Fusobacterium sp. TaxID=68766 RepID=UPI00345C3B62
MKNKKIIYLLGFILSLIILAFSYKDIALFYYVKMGNKNYYSKNYEKAIEYYEKALKIKEDYNIRINLIITDYQMKNYKKVIESPVENGFLKGNSLVLLNENNKNNPKDLEKALDYYKDNMLSDNDINIKKNYEIVQKKLNENQKNQDSNNQKDNKDKKQNNNSNND